MEEKDFHSILADYQKRIRANIAIILVPNAAPLFRLTSKEAVIWAFWAIRMNVQIPIAIIPGTTFVIPNQQKERRYGQ